MTGFICCTDDNLTSILQTYLLEIKTLAHWEKLKINETPPSGCAVLTVSNKCQIHLSLRVSESYLIFKVKFVIIQKIVN